MATLSSGTATNICVICTGDTANFVIAPHPVYINTVGDSVYQLNTIALGGQNGYNN